MNRDRDAIGIHNVFIISYFKKTTRTIMNNYLILNLVMIVLSLKVKFLNIDLF